MVGGQFVTHVREIDESDIAEFAKAPEHGLIRPAVLCYDVRGGERPTDTGIEVTLFAEQEAKNLD